MMWNKAGLFILNAATRQTQWSTGLTVTACGGCRVPAGRPRTKLRYITDPFYLAMAHERGMTRAQVVARSERRLRAYEKLRGHHVRKGHGPYNLWGADNPFIESHAWKYLMRTALVEYKTWKRRNPNATSKNTTAEP